jgi:hypothetical protein
MMCCGKERSKGFWIKRLVFIPLAIAAGVLAFGFVVMMLWNSILPLVLGVSTITFWQALGILVLSKILFGGFNGGKCHYKKHWHEKSEKWMNLSEEEKESLKADWKNRC